MPVAHSITLRVYGLFIHQNHLLVTDEKYQDVEFTKLPGGGLEPGESPTDCLRRELHEEAGQEITIQGHFYTTDFFQASFLDAQKQVLLIYYRARLKQPGKLQTSTQPKAFDQLANGQEVFRWVGLDDLQPQQFTFPTDQLVVAHLLQGWHNGRLPDHLPLSVKAQESFTH